MIPRSAICLCVAGLLFVTYFFMVDIMAGEQRNTNVTGTVYEGKYNTDANLIAIISELIIFVAILLLLAGVSFAFIDLSGGSKGKRRGY